MSSRKYYISHNWQKHRHTWDFDLLPGFQGDDDKDGPSVHATHAAAVAHEVVQDSGELSPNLKTHSSGDWFYLIYIPDPPGIPSRESQFALIIVRFLPLEGAAVAQFNLPAQHTVLSINPLRGEITICLFWLVSLFTCMLSMENFTEANCETAISLISWLLYLNVFVKNTKQFYFIFL